MSHIHSAVIVLPLGNLDVSVQLTCRLHLFVFNNKLLISLLILSSAAKYVLAGSKVVLPYLCLIYSFS